MIDSAIRFDRHKFSGLGYCIYCHDGVVELTSEHIVPFFAGGNVELLSASCKECNKKTSRIDGYCANAIMQDFRHFHKIQTRSKKRPLNKTIRFHTASGSVTRSVPFTDAPPFMLFPEFNPPHILTNGPRNGVVESRANRLWTTRGFAAKLDGLLRPGELRWSVEAGGNLGLFLRFIAKTALAAAAAHLHYDCRTSPLGQVVLGSDKSVSFYVGGDFSPPRAPFMTTDLAPITQETVRIEFGKWKYALADHTDLLGASITFFAAADMPTYVAIIGKAPDADLESLLRAH